MKRLTRFLTILVAILAITMTGAPALAAAKSEGAVLVASTASPTTATFTILSGIEVFAGIQFGGNTYGATFVSQVAGRDSKGNTYFGSLSASVNYRGNGPSSPSNQILGGTWTLAMNGKGTIKGNIDGGTQIVWSDPTLAQGTVTLNFNIVVGTGSFTGIRGSGIFTGHDNHYPGIPLFGIRIPTVDGTLILNY